jgi:uroporphyrin-3 C-methyltransferase
MLKDFHGSLAEPMSCDAQPPVPPPLETSTDASRLALALFGIWDFFRVKLDQRRNPGYARALRQADERLARNSQPRLERVRRAVVKDLDRVRAVGVSDIATLVIKVDEAVRLADELPLLSQPDKRRGANSTPARGAPAVPAAASAAAAAAAGGWRAELAARWDLLVTRVAEEARSLVRVTRIDQPEAMLVAPEQAYFLRENLKLRLLNARLALLSRQFNTAQSDLREVQTMLERYFDRSSRRVSTVNELVRQVGLQARGIVVPHPDETFAALAAVMAGK